MPTVATLQTNFAAVQTRIEAACRLAQRNPAEVRLIWVSKNHPAGTLVSAHAAGARLFGENRVQEVVEKFPLRALDGTLLQHDLHFIGHLQRNKARKVLPLCSTIHSVDTADLWQALDRVAGELGLRRDVFLQVNTSREPNKSGFAADGFLYALASLPPVSHLRLVGLMTLGPVQGGVDAARPCFRQLAALLRQLREHPELGARFPDAKFLSMGMSGDFEAAIEAGSHYLRIGTALFGEKIPT